MVRVVLDCRGCLRLLGTHVGSAAKKAPWQSTLGDGVFWLSWGKKSTQVNTCIRPLPSTAGSGSGSTGILKLATTRSAAIGDTQLVGPHLHQISTADRTHARTGPDTQRAQAHKPHLPHSPCKKIASLADDVDTVNVLGKARKDAPEMALPEPTLCMEGLWIALLLFAARIAISQ